MQSILDRKAVERSVSHGVQVQRDLAIGRTKGDLRIVFVLGLQLVSWGTSRPVQTAGLEVSEHQLRF